MVDASMQAVRFDRYGDRDVYYLADLPMPVPGPGQVLVEVRAAGINPGEAAIRQGAMHGLFPTTFPCGQGSDLAGVVLARGSGVTEFSEGDEVLGFSWQRSSHATHVAVPTTQLIAKPPELSWEVAGSLSIVASTAFAAVRAVGPQTGDTVAVSAAAGGVGCVVVQLLAERGASPILGIASESNHAWLSAHGVTPILYGDGLRERLIEAAPDGIDAFIDLFGPDYVQLAVDLGVSRDRIETIIAFEKAAELGTKFAGSADASSADVLSAIATLVAAGRIEVPIAATYPLNQVSDAFAELEKRHTRGKIVLIP